MPEIAKLAHIRPSRRPPRSFFGHTLALLFRSITTLEILELSNADNITSEGARDLSQLPLLKSLSIGHDNNSVDAATDFLSLDPTIAFPRLQTLSLATTVSVLTSIMRHLRFPSLDRLVVHLVRELNHQPEHPMGPLISALMQGPYSVTLQEVIFRCAVNDVCPADDIARLGALPHLRELQIYFMEPVQFSRDEIITIANRLPNVQVLSLLSTPEGYRRPVKVTLEDLLAVLPRFGGIKQFGIDLDLRAAAAALIGPARGPVLGLETLDVGLSKIKSATIVARLFEANFPSLHTLKWETGINLAGYSEKYQRQWNRVAGLLPHVHKCRTWMGYVRKEDIQ
jgi:hypothetical protein